MFESAVEFVSKLSVVLGVKSESSGVDASVLLKVVSVAFDVADSVPFEVAVPSLFVSVEFDVAALVSVVF